MQIIGELNGVKGEALMLAGGLALRPEELAVFADSFTPKEIIILGTMLLEYDLYSNDAFTQFEYAAYLIKKWLFSNYTGQIQWETDDSPEAPFEDDPVDAIY